MPWEPSRLEKDRLEKMERLQESGVPPYPNRVTRTHTLAEARDLFDPEAEQNPTVTVAGRIRAMRGGGKVAFWDIEDGTGKIQLFLRINNLGEEAYALLTDALDLGDFVQATGPLMTTRSGELSVEAGELKLLAKALSPLPVIKERETEDGEIERYTEFSDIEARYRQRYADLATNPDVREVFRVRARIVSAMRRFLDDADFLEVETPVLQPIYGGAAARPFVTHHNQLHQDLFLRISFELYLKRLLVGMYDGVYEIGRDFRNEGVSFKHNPEFTQLEFYEAYTDYHGMMARTENLLAFVAEHATGSTKFTFQGHKIDMAPPWRRVTLRDAIKENSGIDYVEYPDAESLRAAMRENGLDAPAGATWGKLVDKLLSETVEPTLIQPTFLLDYPRDISPLAKTIPGDPTHVERFEFFIGGLESGNAFTELNDPIDQERRFLEIQELYQADDEEANPLDEDYLRAMRYGMPPCGGCGVGVDRITMLLTDKTSIREVILFPHLRETGA
jgi:lysyl-tRNA synthetase class 2